MALDYGTSSGLAVQMAGPFGSMGASGKITQIMLPAADWKNAESPYFQEVVIDGISASGMVSIQADREQIAYLGESGIALHIDNDGGVTTAWAVGGKPDADMVLQVSITEVVIL